MSLRHMVCPVRPTWYMAAPMMLPLNTQPKNKKKNVHCLPCATRRAGRTASPVPDSPGSVVADVELGVAALRVLEVRIAAAHQVRLAPSDLTNIDNNNDVDNNQSVSGNALGWFLFFLFVLRSGISRGRGNGSICIEAVVLTRNKCHQQSQATTGVDRVS